MATVAYRIGWRVNLPGMGNCACLRSPGDDDEMRKYETTTHGPIAGRFAVNRSQRSAQHDKLRPEVWACIIFSTIIIRKLIKFIHKLKAIIICNASQTTVKQMYRPWIETISLSQNVAQWPTAASSAECKLSVDVGETDRQTVEHRHH